MNEPAEVLNVLRQRIEVLLEQWDKHTSSCKVCDLFQNRNMENLPEKCCEDGRAIIVELQRLL